MKDRILITKYARAVAAALTEAELDSALQDLAIIRDVFADEQKLVILLQSHIASWKQKQEIIKQICEKLTLSKIWQNLFDLLIRNYRFFLVTQIAVKAQNLISERQGNLRISLKFARQQDDASLQQITAYLEKILKKKIITDIEYDKSIIGGFQAETEDMLIDGSIKNNLQRFIQTSCKN